MGTASEYKKILELLQELQDKIAERKIAFKDLGADLFGELIDASFEIGSKEEDIKAVQALSRSYMNSYDIIAKLGNAQLERNYLDNIQCMIRAWMLLVDQQEKDLMTRIKGIQANILPEGTKDDNSCHITIDVREFFMQQNSALGNVDYQRMDVVIKYLAIENYFGKNDYGFYLHQKLQALRSGQSECMPENYEVISREVFRELIQSIEKNGFDAKSELVADSRLFLLDGAHRLAAALYFGVPTVSLRVTNNEVDILPFTLEYLKDGGFSDTELQIIEDKAKELMNQCKVNFSCILWPSVAPYFEQITAEIATACRVVDCHDYIYSEETFPRIVRAVYHIDDIAEWKIEKKIQAMSGCIEKKIRVLELEIMSPRFRLKQMHFNTISTMGERLKQIVRERYMKLVDNYVYNIIIHIGDNFKQSEYMKQLFVPAISLEEYLKEISNIKYVLIKTDTPYCPIDFPKSYAFSKDIDLLCDKKDYEDLKQRTEMFLDKAVKGFEIRILEKDNRKLYRVELNGFLIIQLDIGYVLSGLMDKFTFKVLEKRVEKNGYYIPSVADEICIRINELIKNPHKEHHWQYLRKHKEYCNLNYIEELLMCEREKIEQIIARI